MPDDLEDALSFSNFAVISLFVTDREKYRGIPAGDLFR